MVAIVTRTGGLERRSVSYNGGGWAGLGMTGVVPPHGWSVQSDAGVPITEDSVTQASPVNRCLAILQNSVVSLGNPLPYTVAYDPTTHLPYTQYLSPIPPILTNTFGLLPDGRPRSQSEGIAATVYSMAMFNESFWLTVTRDEMGNPSALTVLHPAFVNVASDANGNTTYSYGILGRAPTPLDPGDVTHIRVTARPGAIRGLSSLRSQALGYGMFLAAIKFGLKFFGQGASPSYLLTTDGPLSEEQTQRILEKLIIEHSGLDMAHLPMLLTNGVKAQKLQATPDEAQYLGTLQHATADCADYFGVPAAWLASAGQAAPWGKTLQEATLLFMRATLSGFIVPLNEAFSSLLPRAQSAMLNTRPLLRGNAADMAKEVQALRTSTVMTENEIRRDYYDLPPIAGGDNLHAPLASNIATPDESLPDDADTSLGEAA